MANKRKILFFHTLLTFIMEKVFIIYETTLTEMLKL